MALTPQEIRFEVCQRSEDQASLAMAWRNDAVTRSMAYRQHEMAWDEFWSEYCESYLGAEVPTAFAVLDGRRIGLIRFRRFRDTRASAGNCQDISIILAPEERGKGLAATVLAAAVQYARGFGIDTLIAEVRRENLASAKAFRRAGFSLLGEDLVTPYAGMQPAAVNRYCYDLTDGFWRGGGVKIVAEAGSNWRVGAPRRDLAMGRALIEAAAAAGADVVKFQTYKPETTYVANAGKAAYLVDSGVENDMADLFADLSMPYEMISALAEAAKEAGIGFMSTGFSTADMQAIDPFVSLHKIASYEISHVRLIDFAAATGKPTMMSTGASDMADIAWAVARYHAQGGRNLCLLQCTASYPSPLSALNLKVLPDLHRRFGVAVGFSDHSREPLAGPAAAVALGARCIEKHFTLHNALPGPDHAFAVTPDELAAMVRAVRAAEAVLGDGIKAVQPEERELAAFARRGVQALRHITAGDLLRENDTVAILRPGTQSLGIHPRHLDEIEGKTAIRDIPCGAGIRPGDWA